MEQQFDLSDFVNADLLTGNFMPNTFAHAFSTPEITLPEPRKELSLVTVRCDLLDAKPPIWRRLELRSDVTLDVLHVILQVSMGWTGYHLHQFSEPNPQGRWGTHFLAIEDEDGEGTPEESVQLNQVLREVGDRILYIYDFGDDWHHRIKVEKIEPASDATPLARCVGGRKACPVEDSGGAWMWNKVAQSLREDPTRDKMILNEDLEDYVDWLPEDFDPDEFDLQETNEVIDDILSGK